MIKNLENYIMKDFFYEYWKNETRLIDYFLADYSISIAHDLYKYIREMIDLVPLNNPQILTMMDSFNNKMNEAEYKRVTVNTKFFKLSWKQNFKVRTQEGDETFYGYIIKLFKND